MKNFRNFLRLFYVPIISKKDNIDGRPDKKKDLKSWYCLVTDTNITNNEAKQIALSINNYHVVAYYLEREDTSFLMSLSFLNENKSYLKFLKKEIRIILDSKAKLFFKDKKPSEILELANLIKSEIFWHYVEADDAVDKYIKALPLEYLNFEKYPSEILGKVSVNSNFLTYKEDELLKELEKAERSKASLVS